MVCRTPSPVACQKALRALIRTPDLDGCVAREPELLELLTLRLEALSREAWEGGQAWATGRVGAARLVTQRALYDLNRVRLYWGDDPEHYANERSATLLELQHLLELPFQLWLERQVPVEARPWAREQDQTDHPWAREQDQTDHPWAREHAQVSQANAAETIRAWAERDRTPISTPIRDWFAEVMNLAGYRRLLALASLNGLVEASQLSRALGGAPDAVQATLTRIFVEEYGAGRLAKKHSTYFARMLEAQGMSSEPEAYAHFAPWEVLSVINHAFYLAENKRHYLRFCGALTYTEVSTPASFDGYAKAAKRLGLSDGLGDYWSLHVREDQRHGAWMVDDVALPLMRRFPERWHDVVFGYAQQRALEGMAAAATARACQEAVESQGSSSFPIRTSGVP